MIYNMIKSFARSQELSHIPAIKRLESENLATEVEPALVQRQLAGAAVRSLISLFWQCTNRWMCCGCTELMINHSQTICDGGNHT